MRLYVNGEQVTSMQLRTQSLFKIWKPYEFRNSVSDCWLQFYRINTELNGYLAELNFIDGQALTPASFGETNEDTNQWQAIEYDGSYGTNGFYLKFQDSSALGDDSSGNTNDFTATNLVATDQVLDSPTRNYCTLNPLDFSTGTLSEGNLKWVSTGAAGNGAFGSFAFDIASTDNKYYFEVLKVSGDSVIGVVPDNVPPSNLSRPGSYTYYADGDKYSGVTGSTYGASYTDGDIISVAVGAGSITFYKNGASQGVAFTGLTGDFKPALYEVTATFVANFGQDSSFAGAKTAQGNGGDGEDFYYTPPTGYKALNTDNLDDPAIALPTDHFNTNLWTGNGSTGQSINVGFQPDLLIAKERTTATYVSARNSVTGVTKSLFTGLANAEYTETDGVTAFTSTGFNLSGDGYGYVNRNTYTYVGWNWLAGGTASSNGDGSITSSVSANTTAGFSIVSYTGHGATTGTVGHGLGVKPDLIITKYRSGAASWSVYNSPQGATKVIWLDDTSAEATGITYWRDTEPTASVFSVGASGTTGGNANPYIAYCFNSIEGYSKVGTYSSNNSVDGPFIYLGFTPAYILLKCINATDNWNIYDIKRNGYNGTGGTYQIRADTNEAGFSSAATMVDLVSNGMKIRTNDPGTNGSGRDYLFYAVASNPFKTSNAR